MPTSYFAPPFFKFLTELTANNDRTWFNSNKTRYIHDVQEPALQFISDFAPRLRKISPHYVADPRPMGGSMFRIYRDTRFSKDKTPYKEYVGIAFRQPGTDVHAPGLYLHLQPGACYAGVGVWRPESPVANRIRQAIADQPAAWKSATRGKGFLSSWTIEGETLSRPPKGFDPDHPFIDDIKKKDFTAGAKLTQKQVAAPRFLDDYAKLLTAAKPFQAFLAKAVGVHF
jgi:uncharacterized protein (TIGR02453 family)